MSKVHFMLYITLQRYNKITSKQELFILKTQFYYVIFANYDVLTYRKGDNFEVSNVKRLFWLIFE